MAIGYLVTLGNGSLDANDYISASQSNFTQSGSAIGVGSWTWTGVYEADGVTYTDVTDTGTYYLGTDGNVYFIPDTWMTSSGDAFAVNPPAYVAGDGTVSGDTGNDVIDETYTDTDGDVVTINADIISAGAGDDVARGFAGNDTIDGGTGSDTLVGGAGNDDISGGDDNDTIYGDFDTSTASTSESLNWLSEGVDGTDLSGGFTQDTGTMNVTVGFTNDGGNTAIETNNGLTYVDTANGEPQSTTSTLAITGNAGPNMTAEITFDPNVGTDLSDEVSNVSFRINDVDFDGWQDIITVNGYDSDGNIVAVTLTPGDPTNDTVSGQTVTASTTSESQTDLAGSVLVTIANPVHRIEIIYSNGGTVGQALWITDVHFDTIPATGADDVISGGAGDDLIYGGAGNDSINGDDGFDTVYGGDGDDVINNSGVGSDVIHGDAGNDSVFGGIDSDTVYAATITTLSLATMVTIRSTVMRAMTTFSATKTMTPFLVA